MSSETPTPAERFPLIQSISSPNGGIVRLQELVGSLARSDDLASELEDIFTQFNTITEVNQQQYTQGTALTDELTQAQQHINSISEQLLSLRSSYSKVERDLASEQRHFNEVIATLKNIRGAEVEKPGWLKSATIEVNMFDGKDTDGLEAFLFSLNAKFNNNATEFDTEQSKLVFYANHLKGAAHTAIRHTLRENGTVELTDCHEITAILKVAFLHADAADRATNVVKGMKQGKEIFSTWVGRFLAECYKSNLTEPEKIRELRRATATPLFQAVNNTQRAKPLPVILSEYVALTRTEDLILTQNLAQSATHGQQIGNWSPHNFQTADQIAAVVAPATTANDAMDISQLDLTQLVNGKLHPNEKKRRLDAGLCLYDGGDHATAECPKIAAKEKKEREQLMASATKEALLAAAALK